MPAAAAVRRETWLLLVTSGLATAVLYAALLPLWEGFDEPFHYGFVQTVKAEHLLPVLGRTLLTDEVWRSLPLVPASMAVHLNVPASLSFDDYQGLSASERAKLRAELENNNPPASGQPAPLNYEAQQAPLAYVVLALLDQSSPLLQRIFWLRVVAGGLAVVLTWFAAKRIGTELAVPAPLAIAALGYALCTQMFYAATAHVANDWLAIPLGSLLLAALLALQRQATRQHALYAALVLTAGLLTKAYFLAFVPLWLGLVVVLTLRRKLAPLTAAIAQLPIAALAAPWYLRNLQLYGNVSGVQEASAGIGALQVLKTIPSVPWPSQILSSLRGSLWTGNNSFTSFSLRTLDVWLVLGAAGLLLLAIDYYRRRHCSAADRLAVWFIGSFLLALIYVTASAYAFSHGHSAGAAPWYPQVILLPMVLLSAKGFASVARTGQFLAAFWTALSVYILLATFWLKLFPWYGGLRHAHVTLRELANWYRAGLATSLLPDVALVSLPVLLTLLALVTLLWLFTAAAIVHRLLAPQSWSSSPTSAS